MYTSCGWFFDDISGIETVQIIAYAARVLQLARQLFGDQAEALEPAFLARLAEAAPTWPVPAMARCIYKEQVRSRQLGLEQVAAHYAISSMFSSFAEETDLFCYRVRRNSWEIFTSGRGRLALGRARIVSAITTEQGVLLVRGSALWRSEHYRRRQGLHRGRCSRVRSLAKRPPTLCSALTSLR
jgi:hypothetical protein